MSNLKRTLLAAVALTLALGLAGAAPAQALDRELGQQIMKAAVQLGPLLEVEMDDGKHLRALGWGSGTIISPDGLILTNHHVADVGVLADELPDNARVLEGYLCVYVTSRADEPPSPAFIAEVQTASAKLDLAVLRITMTTSGEEIDWKRVRLPYCELGDSDELEVLDNLYIFGYPGIGGETITVTQGVVGGFTAEEGIGNRAWIKTSTGIAGGNSGGTGVNDYGELVGVPTQAGRGGVGGKDEYVDCRPLADTNGDGWLDENDTCVPMGMFINALRPINLALPLIEEALEGGGPGLQPDPEPEPDKGEAVFVMGTIVDADNGRPIPGALFIVLNPGVTFAEWESDDQVYGFAEADNQGEFILWTPLQRGQSYTMIAGLKGYATVYEDDVYVGKDTDVVVDLTIRLKRQ